MKRPAEALEEFEATLKKEPNRFRALFGAAKSAALAGDSHKAQTYYRSLVRICQRGDQPGRPDLVEARRLPASSH
jgi:Tfp pilus assembly protein PilF